MDVQQIRNALAANKPFQIAMANGKVYPVEHPDFVFVTPSGRYVWVFSDPDSGRFASLNPDQIVSLDGLDEEAMNALSSD